MVVRTLDTQSCVELPNLSADEAALVAKLLLTVGRAAAREKKLPEPIAAALDKIEAALGPLDVARLTPTPAGPPSPLAVKRRLGNAWSGLSGFLVGITRVPDGGDEATAAQRVLDLLLPDGLAWVRREPLVVWNESDKRVKWMGGKRTAADLRALSGAERFVAAIGREHEALGAVAGITHERPAPPASPGAADERGAMLAAMKSLVIQVVAHVNHVSAAAALGARLLRPLAEWQGDSPAKAAPAEPPAAGGTGAAKG